MNIRPGAPTNLVLSTQPAQAWLSWTAPSPLPADFDHYNVYCDSTTPYDFSDGYVVAQTTYTLFIDTITSYTSYKYQVTTVDNGSIPMESDPSNSQFLVQSDTMAPVMTSLDSLTHPVSTVWYSNTRPNMSFSAYDNGTAGVMGYYYMWSTSATLTQAQLLVGGTLLAGATYFQEQYGLDDGQWYFHAMAVDNVGNLSTPLVYPLRIDTMPPTPMNLAAVKGQNQIEISWSVSTAPADLSHYIVYCDSSSVSSTSLSDWSSQFVVTNTVLTAFTHAGLTNYNIYKYRVRSVDARGNRVFTKDCVLIYT